MNIRIAFFYALDDHHILLKLFKEFKFFIGMCNFNKIYKLWRSVSKKLDFDCNQQTFSYIIFVMLY